MISLFSALAASWRHRSRAGLAVVLALTGLLGLERATAGDAAVKTDAESSAALAHVILGIVGYARWPAGADVRRICLAGDGIETRVLGDRLSTAGGRAVTVQWLVSDSEQWSESCDVAYLGQLSAARRNAILAQMLGRPILTVIGDDPLCAGGSMFCLDVTGGDVSLQVNLDSIARSGIRINPKVLQLARRKGPRP